MVKKYFNVSPEITMNLRCFALSLCKIQLRNEDLKSFIMIFAVVVDVVFVAVVVFIGELKKYNKFWN